MSDIPHQDQLSFERLRTDSSLPWNTQITLSRLDSSQLSPEQEGAYIATMDAMKKGRIIGDYALSYSGDQFRQWHFGIRLGASDEPSAVRASMKIVMNSIELVGVNLEDLEFMQVNSASDAKMERAAAALKAAGFLDQIRVGDSPFIGRDSLRYAARSVFNGLHDPAEEVTAELAAIDASAVEIISPKVAAAYLLAAA